MQKLDDTQSRLVLTMIRERDSIDREIHEYLRFVGREMDRPRLVQMPDGLYLVDDAGEQKKGGAGPGQPHPSTA